MAWISARPTFCVVLLTEVTVNRRLLGRTSRERDRDTSAGVVQSRHRNRAAIGERQRATGDLIVENRPVEQHNRPNGPPAPTRSAAANSPAFPPWVAAFLEIIAQGTRRPRRRSPSRRICPAAAYFRRRGHRRRTGKKVGPTRTDRGRRRRHGRGSGIAGVVTVGVGVGVVTDSASA